MKITLQPKCLIWARERAGLTTSELAKKLRVKHEKVIEWEKTGEITLALAEKLANVTHIPFGYLFLPEPLVEELPINDFRTVRTQEIARPSVDLLDVVNDALRRQDWYRDYLVANGGEALEFVGSLDLSTDTVEAANRIRRVVAWDSPIITQASNWEEALSRRIDTVEDAGILVMRSGIVGNNTHRPLSVSEFRGFALADSYAPLIFINGRDAKAGQVFTLAHELVHIWLGVSGVTNLNQTYSPNIEIERYCNAVAAELLVPSKEIRELWAKLDQSAVDKIAFAVRHFKVSSLVILRRLHDNNLIPTEEFRRRYTDELTGFVQKEAKGDSGGDFYLTLRARVGKRFASALVESTLEGETSYREAFQLLGTNNPNTFREFASTIGIAV